MLRRFFKHSLTAFAALSLKSPPRPADSVHGPQGWGGPALEASLPFRSRVKIPLEKFLQICYYVNRFIKFHFRRAGETLPAVLACTANAVSIEEAFSMFRFSPRPAAGPVDFIIAGLGNPGREYEGTRHNAGFMALDRLAESRGAPVKRVKFKGLVGDCLLGDRRVLLLKPGTFMNLSGQSVTEAMAFYKIPPERTLILFDDINLPPGRLRVRRKGSDGGHNGMKNIIYLSGSDQFPRIKIGVGQKPHPDYNLADWVLSRFSQPDLKELDAALDHACAAAELIVRGDTDRAMNLYN